jgi:hypothetical protein
MSCLAGTRLEKRHSEQQAAGSAILSTKAPPGFRSRSTSLLRLTIARTGDAEYRLLWTTHHLLVDGWSWPLIFSELSALYGDEQAVLPPVCGYREYIGWLKDRDWSLDRQFWSGILGKVIDATPMPSLAVDGSGSNSGATTPSVVLTRRRPPRSRSWRARIRSR